jgi:cyclophilin family peptidyl-prolyl cis-trans isomerase
VNLLEAMGKTMKLYADDGLKKSISEEDRYFLMELGVLRDAEQRGFGKALYWLHYRGLIDEGLVSRIPYILQRAQGDGKMNMIYAMSRYRDPSWFVGQEKYLLNWVKNERNAEARIYLMSMLGSCGTDSALSMLLAFAASKSEDNRVRQAAVVNAGRCAHITVPDLIPLVETTEGVVARLAVETMIGEANAEEATRIVALCEGRGADIMASALRLLEVSSPGAGFNRMRELESSSQEHYDKVHYIRAMGSYSGQESVLKELLNGISQSSTPMLKSAYADALVEYIHSPTADKRGEEIVTLSDWIKLSFVDQDAGVQALLASLIYEDGSKLKTHFAETAFLRVAMDNCSLPREIETYNEVLHAVCAIDGTTYTPRKLEYNNPINWDHIRGLGKKVRARVNTNEGDFVMELDVEKTPASVSNFVSLVDSGFYNEKYFHRVVPNFVIQTGCPRGDGYGSTDYTIRSEFGVHDYATGAVGLASSGKDTESCQWFVTHQPTPGLEGRYTIIGYVKEGMETVHKIGVGDKITKIVFE